MPPLARRDASGGLSRAEQVAPTLLLLPRGNQRPGKEHKTNAVPEKDFKGQSSFVLKNQNLFSLKTSLVNVFIVSHYKATGELETVFFQASTTSKPHYSPKT